MTEATNEPEKSSRKNDKVTESLKLRRRSLRRRITAESQPPVFVDKRYVPLRIDQ
jgi:hypothetical protein